MTLLSHLSPDGGGLPSPADAHRRSLGIAAWNEALAAGDDPQRRRARAWSATARGDRLLGAIFGNSPFLSGVAVAEWVFLTRLVEEGLDRPFDEILADTEKTEDRGENQAALMQRLRIGKRRIALLTAVGEITGCWPLEQQMAALSRFAEAAIGATVRHLLHSATVTGLYKPLDAAAPERHSGLIVLGLGKLGGGELNYSSDVDLILLYDASRAPLSDRENALGFYTHFARNFVRILDERTGDGYVFRTDLRLRPDPRSTPLAMSTIAALTYYEGVGQNWERAALIKARPVAGDRLAGSRFLLELQPFIWRRYLDFAAIADIHSIKRQIQAHRGGGRIAVEGHDIKIGRGGIREIEFFAQTQQLIWGGRQRELRTAKTCDALRRLADAGHIETAVAEALIEDYRFLRRVEHHLQMIDDQQTHRLPANQPGIAHLAVFLGYDGADRFVTELHHHLASVETYYAGLFEEAPSLAGPGNLVFTGAEDDPETLATLARLGFADPPRIAAMVRGWHHGRIRATRSQRAREILTELVPELLRIFGTTPHPDEGLLRFDQFLSRLPAGVQLFSLFHANPGLLTLVADIMAGAPLLADRLAQRPALLDAVLTNGFSAPLPGQEALAADLANLLGSARDFEDRLDLLRRWANERRFQVGVQLLRRGLDGAASGIALSDIAETTLCALLPLTLTEFARAHGEIAGGAFAIVAMGRLGSREMSLASDIDLILIYNAPSGVEASDGARPLSVSAYYARLSQRLIGAVTAPTAEGRLYEVDMRLRPSGSSGPIASSLDAFAQYQRDAAWTWERMALTRARPVAGDVGLCQRIDEAIRAALTAPRDASGLLVDVADMRERLAEANPRPSPWDLRNRRGGLIDLEFVVQYLMLREAHRVPQVLQRDSGRSLAALAAIGALPPRAVQELGNSLNLLHHVRASLALLFAGIPAPEELAGPTGASLARCAGAVDFAHLDADISSACARISFWYDRIVARPAGRVVQKSENATGDAVR